MELTSVYFSRIVGNNIYTDDMKIIGKLKDLGISTKFETPKVLAAKIQVNHEIKYIKWNNISIKEVKGKYVLTCTEQEEESKDDFMLLGKHVLDKQIIDVNGRKVVRTNDIRLIEHENGFFAVAVDIGMEGILRRLGVAKFLKKIGVKTESKLLLWKDMQAVVNSNEDIVLSNPYNKLDTLHPSDLADIIEDFDSKTGMHIFSNLDNSKAADVLEELEEDAQVSVLKNLSVEKAADILEEMPADEAADILDGLNKNYAEELLSNMEKEASDEVRELLEYEEDEVGSIMNTEFMSFLSDSTTQYVIDKLRELKPEMDSIHSIYIVDHNNKFIGTVSLRDLIVNSPDTNLGSIMANTSLIYVQDKSSVDDLIGIVSKYNLFSVPVVNSEMELLGSVIINDIVYDLLKNRKIR